MISIKDLNVVFNIGTPSQKTVLNNFSLEIEEGEFVVMLGSNGAGKSTLFNAIMGNIPYEGEIIIDGKNINKLPSYKRSRNIGIVYQDPLKGTAPNLKVFENMLLASHSKTFLGFRKSFKENAIAEISKYNLGLENQLEVSTKLLSGGQRQALTLFMATYSNPKVLLLDEHTAALDPHTQETIMDITDNIVSSKKATTLMITHNLKTALKYGTRLIILNGGKIVVDIKGEEKKNATEEELLKLYSKHLSDSTLFKQN